MGLPDIEAFAARVASATRFDGALDLLAEVVCGLGFDGVDYAELAAARVFDGSWAGHPIAARHFPAGWQALWRTHGGADPILPTCFRRGLPVDWQEVGGAPHLSAAQREALACLDGFGFRSGITVPIHLPANRFAFVSAVSTRGGAEWRVLRTAASGPLMLLSHTFHHLLAVRRAGSAGAPDLQLTRRERECLQHAANGLSAPATARHLNRSVETVRAHLKKAMAKLGARTVAQSVAIAAACGVVESAAPDALHDTGRTAPARRRIP